MIAQAGIPEIGTLVGSTASAALGIDQAGRVLRADGLDHARLARGRDHIHAVLLARSGSSDRFGQAPSFIEWDPDDDRRGD
jgi:superfamily II DNA or RNA helicase